MLLIFFFCFLNLHTGNDFCWISVTIFAQMLSSSSNFLLTSEFRLNQDEKIRKTQRKTIILTTKPWKEDVFKNIWCRFNFCVSDIFMIFEHEKILFVHSKKSYVWNSKSFFWTSKFERYRCFKANSNIS